MNGENIYNGSQIAGCRFSFWLPLAEVANSSARLPAKSL